MLKMRPDCEKCSYHKVRPKQDRAVNQLIDYQLIAILIDYFNYQFNYLKPT
jgi:hypothetical protein